MGHRPPKVIYERPPQVRKAIRRDNRITVAQFLPKIVTYNVRSLIPKIRSVAADILERESDLIFLTEIWQKEDDKKHQYKIEELLELDGIKYISTPRTGARRGGGAALAVRLENFSITKLNISIPKSLEVVWGLIKPKIPNTKISTIIACSFYSPPKSRKNSALIDHLTITLQGLLKTHSNAGIIISGDRNNIDIPVMLSIDPSLHQIVTLPTRGSRILDVIVTNLRKYYNDPVILPPIMPDKPGLGAPSDHSGVLATPLASNTHHISRTKVFKTIRPLPDSLIDTFHTKLSTQFATECQMEVDQMVESFQNTLNTILNSTFPEKKIILSPQDKPWFNEHLRTLKRKRMREYERHGKSDKYLQLRTMYEEKLKTETLKYLDKIATEVVEGRRGSSYPALKKLGARPWDQSRDSFQLPAHQDQNLSPAQSAEIIAAHFSSISQEYKPVSLYNLPPNIQDYLLSADQSVAPILTHEEVYRRIRKAKKPKGQVPGDLPPKLVKHCAHTLTPPVTAIFNNITTQAKYPSHWKIEQQLAIPKIIPPQNEDDLRNLSKTPFFSKVYESFIAGWLLPIIQPYLDPDQCGLKGLSITHYLIKLLHFVHSTLDMRKPHTVLAACIDLSKAFNRCDHSIVIQDLFDMHTPPWLLKIFLSYLSGRSMHLTFNEARSSRRMLPGGGPQGAYLGGIIFIIKYNGALLRPPVPRSLSTGPINKSKSKSVKFVDDGTVAVSVDLKACLIPDPVSRPRPLKFHERTQHILPPENNLLQWFIRDAERFTQENKMVINRDKTHIISFTKSRKWDFPPEVTFSEGGQIKCQNETKLLGVIVSNDLRWSKNTEFICNRARKKLWILSRLDKFGLGKEKLFDVYTKEIRSLLELAVPVWHSGLTKLQSNNIERIQKIAFKMILKENYTNYDVACKLLATQTLQERRVKLCRIFAFKNLKSENSMFQKVNNKTNTRQQQKQVKDFKCNFKRFYNSSLPYLTRLINGN